MRWSVQSKLATLLSDVITLYNNAARRPVNVHATLVELAVDKVQRSPQSDQERNRKKHGGVYVRLDDRATHSKVCMALYDTVRCKLEHTFPDCIPSPVVH